MQFGSQYGAGPETLWKLFRSTEDKKTGKLLYPEMSLTEARRLQEAWLAGCPEIKRGWKEEMTTFARQGCIVEPVTGRRRDFLDQTGDKQNLSEIVNFPIQASGAGIVNLATLNLLAEFGPSFERWDRTKRRMVGLINQTHDSLLFEVPLEHARSMAKRVTEIMRTKLECYPRVEFTAEADVGMNWEAV
jgi:DNA polymerase I-like protein with 3'-5' exonuclease and polymerase domains